MRVLHVPFSYYPSPHGGTEVYVAALANSLQSHGVASTIAAPGEHNETYEWAGLTVHRFKTSSNAGLESLYGEGDELAAAAFGRILDRVHPDLVHFHALTPGASVLAMRETKRRGIPLLFTYHTPTVSCVRGTMMKWGRTPCEGTMNARLCTACALHGKGLPKIAGIAMAAAHAGMQAWLGKKLGNGKLATALQMPALVRKRHAATRTAFELSDRVVAVCDWVRKVLLANGVPKDKVTLCRQGLPATRPVTIAGGVFSLPPEKLTSARPLRLAYFGRLDPTKGVQVVIEALQRKPKLPIHFDIYGIAQGDTGIKWQSLLTQMAKADKRVRFLEPVESTNVAAVMRAYDLIVAPSIWLETGPLVAYEAFAAGVPVLGTNLGGIAELVVDGQTGRLLPAGNVQAWLDELGLLVERPGDIADWRSRLPQARTMSDAATEMAEQYKTCLEIK